jgi:hypothetical protein
VKHILIVELLQGEMVGMENYRFMPEYYESVDEASAALKALIEQNQQSVYMLAIFAGPFHHPNFKDDRPVPQAEFETVYHSGDVALFGGGM